MNNNNFFDFLKPRNNNIITNNSIAILYILIVVIVVQYPDALSNVFSDSIGKVFMLILIIFITNYSIMAGLTATAIMILFTIYLSHIHHKSYVENMDNMEDAKQKQSIVDKENDKEKDKKREENEKDSKIKPYEPELTPTTKDNVLPPKPNNIDLQKIEEQVKPVSSKSLPEIKLVQNPNPAPTTKEGFCSTYSSF